jgi:hypothetical protein
MTSQWKHKGVEHIQTRDLDRFAQTGLGTFSATTVVPEKGQRITFAGEFHLERDAFSYKWDRSTDGKNFVMNGVFILTRESASAAPTP